MESTKSYPIVLSIAGSDSSGGAGIQADIKTFSALGVYGATAITAITAQNTLGVFSQLHLNPQLVYEQICCVMDDLHPSVVKIGMLANAEIVHSVADALSKYNVTIVLDPVMVSTSGHRLLSVEARDVIKERLLPMLTIITPNIPEMIELTGMNLLNITDKETAAKHLLDFGVRYVLLKGGHEDGNIKTDFLFYYDSDSLVTKTFSSEMIVTPNTHGTGCTLSSAIASFIAKGFSVEESVAKAKQYVSDAIFYGADIAIGNGHGPINHSFNPQKMIVL
ncbi:MAG: bifunctional hydroxymethylpyrimidine kinase/phosphomethylpyrimidine kinase [Bacteroidales bacterium]|nr:bifunctional hydroxymethylpyrimidine kinase/phosphomethylpyrimidine kinase [Bacteroidales bacterium]